jgi:hypothetical protein
MAVATATPETRPEIGAPEDCVRDHREQQHHSDRCAHPTASSSLAEAPSVSALGPYGVSRSVKPPALRNRLLIPRSTKINAVPTRAYKSTTAMNMIHTPV